MPSKIKDTEIGFQGQHFYAGMDGHEERWLVTVQRNGLRSESNAPEDFDGYEDGESCPEAGTDSDSNDVPDDEDNCPSIPNPGWEENDNDGIGDICDSLGGPIPTMFGWGIMLPSYSSIRRSNHLETDSCQFSPMLQDTFSQYGLLCCSAFSDYMPLLWHYQQARALGVCYMAIFWRSPRGDFHSLANYTYYSVPKHRIISWD